ncbi:sodium-dependent phosphate transporter 2-like [Asterias amurensis]|uniref:sodium-dependent phosphate transporter 2-like n=1 Tax=Asterias amurensis TaxID=7602 RepID=UPI003AB1CB3A
MTDFSAYDTTYLWIVVVAFVVAFVLAIGLGANDCANSFGTAVGSKVFTIFQACLLAAIFETLGAILLGSRVSDTIRKGLFDPLIYTGYEQVLMIGNLCALFSAALWLLVATVGKIPVSASHSIVGATLGFHLVIFGGEGIDWAVVIKIVISWFISPVLSGIISCIIFGIIKYTLLETKQQLKWGLISLPFWYFIIIFINFFAVFLGSDRVINVGIWLVPVIAGGAAIFVAIAVYLFLVPYTQSRAVSKLKLEKVKEAEEATCKETNVDDAVDGRDGANGVDTGSSNPVFEHESIPVPNGNINNNNSTAVVSKSQEVDEVKIEVKDEEDFLDTPKRERIGKESAKWLVAKDSVVVTVICGPLQGLSACFAAFTHGGNDVSNAIGPLVSLYLVYIQGEISSEASTPIWILLYGGAGISAGLFLLGRRVIETVGSDLTPMTPSTGLAINIGAAITVLIASNLGIPISTTHCLVGSVCAVGFVRSRQAVDWRLFSGIFSAWIFTVPVTVLLSAALMGLLQHTIPGTCTLVPLNRTADVTSSMQW